MRGFAVSTVVMGLALAGCGPSDAGSDADATPSASATPTAAASTVKSATAALKTADGKNAGTAKISEGLNGLRIEFTAMNLPAGDHGVHVHMTGKCEGPQFESAGGHWNPTKQEHGLEGQPGQHAGDMPNLTVADDGTGKLTYQLVGGTWDELMDADSAAFVVHAKADDQKTDPSGESGDRLACGVFAAAS